MRRLNPALIVVATLILAIHAHAADFYVSTSGNAGAAGSLADPWDLQTALDHPVSIQPGDTIWLRGGTYRGSFTSRLVGTSAAPIAVRAYRRERVVFDHDPMLPCNSAAALTCSADASRCSSIAVPPCSEYVLFRDLELTYSDEEGRLSLPAGGCTDAPECCYIDGQSPPLKPECGDSPSGIARAAWKTIDVQGRGIELINLIVHDAGNGLEPGYTAEDTQISGALVFNNGWLDPAAGRGVGIHIENLNASFHRSRKTVAGSLVWNNFGRGVQAYTAVPRLVQNVGFDGVVSFNNGSPAAAFFAAGGAPYSTMTGVRYENLRVSSEEPMGLISVRSSCTYQPAGTAATKGLFGSSYDNNTDLIFKDNYLAGPGLPLSVDRWTTVRLAGNTLVGGATPDSGDPELLAGVIKGDCKANLYSANDYPLWDHNSYAFTGSGMTPFFIGLSAPDYLSFASWKATMSQNPSQPDSHSTYASGIPSSNAVFVQPNEHEPGRAHVAVYNWQGLASVSVDLTAAGIVPGQGFKIYNVQAFDLDAAIDYFGTVVASGVYDPGSPMVAISMTDNAVTEPIGSAAEIASTLPQFGAFLVRTTPCGDGSLDIGEQCDDGDLDSGDGCSAACVVESCFGCTGTPSVCSPDDGDSCDDGLFCNGNEFCSGGVCGHSGSPCPADPCQSCSEATDGCASAAGVACASDGDACTEDSCDGAGTCVHLPTTGNPCDEDNPCSTPGVCAAGTCQPGAPVLVCGDGNPCGSEPCDDGNADNGDGCDNNCTVSGCGNLIVAGGETCDDGNSLNGDGCDNNCTASACGNGVRVGSESCDDGNATNGDGCESDCRYTPAMEAAAAGGTVTTDTNATGATTERPIQISLTTPNAGTVSIIEQDEENKPDGILVLGAEFEIEAPPATAAEPLVLVLYVDASVLPAGVEPSRLDVARNGVVVENCTGASGVASPDPCLSSRHLLGNGDVELTVLTSHASRWSVVVRGLSTADQKCVNAINAAAVKVAKAQGAVAASCLKQAANGEEANAQACLSADGSGKIDAAMRKTSAIAAGKCGTHPLFGFTGPNDTNHAAQQAVLALTEDVFGANLSTSVIAASSDAAAAACQQNVFRGVHKLMEAKAKLFLKCKKSGLVGKTELMVSASAMEACFAVIDSGNSAKAAAATAKLAKTIAGKCAGVGGEAAFPGTCAGDGHLSGCLDKRIDCHLCRMFNAADGLDRDCDRFDDSSANASCP